MEPVTTVEIVPPFPPTMQELERKITDLESKITDLEYDRDLWRDKYHSRMAQIDALEMYVKENFDYIDENVSQELVDIFALEITKDYDVTVTVTFSGTVSVPLNYDMDSLENDLNASLESHYYSADVEADFSEDRMEIDWSES
jgi:outer membrane murein-binding lipoprotein Lpp